jgi:hypothetical protein
MIEVENFKCSSKKEAETKERDWIERLKPELNAYIPTRTEPELRRANIEHFKAKEKQYRDTHKERIKETNQKYTEAHREEINARYRRYYEENREKESARKKRANLLKKNKV